MAFRRMSATSIHVAIWAILQVILLGSQIANAQKLTTLKRQSLSIKASGDCREWPLEQWTFDSNRRLTNYLRFNSFTLDTEIIVSVRYYYDSVIVEADRPFRKERTLVNVPANNWIAYTVSELGLTGQELSTQTWDNLDSAPTKVFASHNDTLLLVHDITMQSYYEDLESILWFADSDRNAKVEVTASGPKQQMDVLLDIVPSILLNHGIPSNEVFKSAQYTAVHSRLTCEEYRTEHFTFRRRYYYGSDGKTLVMVIAELQDTLGQYASVDVEKFCVSYSW